MNLEQIIRARYSARTYSAKPVVEETMAQIMEYAASIENPLGPDVRYIWLDKKTLPKGEKLGTYGIIRGADLYLATAVPEDEHAMEALGYAFEKLVLYMTGLGLGTCWLGGTFNKKAFEAAMELKDSEIFCIVSPVGYPAEKRSLVESIMRKGAGSDKRMAWEELFFEENSGQPITREAAGEYAFALDMVRLAPSAVNRQPWRIIRKDGMFHFYEVGGENKMVDMHRIDVGIAAAHFHMAAEEKGLEGSFVRGGHEDVTVPEGWEYICSWKTV